MNGMFNECSEIDHLNLSNFNTSNVTNMLAMFNDCRKLKEIIGIEKFNTINVTNMCCIFSNCSELEYLN